MPIVNYGRINVDYSPNNVGDAVAKDIADIFQRISYHYPDDFFYNLAYPNLSFELTKINDEIGYQITFHGITNIADPYLEFIRKAHKELQKKYKISMVFLDSSGKLAFQYTGKNYWSTLLKYNSLLFLMIPPVVVFSLWLSNYLFSLLSSVISNETVMSFINDILPAIVCYPITIIAIKSSPKIPATYIISCLIVLITVFLFYLFTGNGLIGSLILLVAFILKSIQDSL